LLLNIPDLDSHGMPGPAKIMASSGTHAYYIHVHVDDGRNKWLAGEGDEFRRTSAQLLLPSAPSPLYMSLRVE